MTTDGGGWMLFLNYSHLAGQPTEVSKPSEDTDDVKLPTSLSENRHINLSQVGYKSFNDAYHLRFLCAGQLSQTNEALTPEWI